MRVMAVVMVSLMALAGGCGFASSRVCDDVGARAGGCEPNQPSFTALDCEGLAREFGEQLEARFFDVLEESDREESYATQARGDRTLTLIRLNQHMRANDVRCDPDDFLTASEQWLSDDFKETAPDYIDDGDIPYDWSDYQESIREEKNLLEWWQEA